MENSSAATDSCVAILTRISSRMTDILTAVIALSV